MKPLGQPIPDSVHAVSVSLPRWQDVVGYEEKTPAVMTHVKTGYPRFVIHPFVQEMAKSLGHLPWPSPRVAQMATEFIKRSGAADTEKTFWQHTGLIVSSRQAEAFLSGRKTENVPDLFRSLRRQLAGFYDCGEDDIFLQPTGMAAQFAALRAVMARAPGKPTVQLGFPYVDTLKLQQKFGAGVTLLHNLSTIECDLHDLLHRESLAAAFGEIPGNPLLGSADLRRVTPLLREHSVPLVADDVVATPFNVDLSAHAALIATSLTKYIAGTGDVMGGALICNPRSPFYAELKAIVASQHEELLWWEDAAVLEREARGFPERMRRYNANGLWLAERLRCHPGIEKVWYPKWEFAEVYETVRRPDGGWGSLITFLPKQAETRSPKVYDRLELYKGPSLGTVFTLACPFTLLAHYTELEWAEACGVSRYLIRVSIGLEDATDLWHRLDRALM